MDKEEAKQRNAMIAVIESWKRNKCLWDPAHPKWYNIDARNKAYKSVLMVYRKLEPSASLYDVKRRLNNMKASYKKEYRKVKRIQSTSGKVDAYVPKLWYYKYLLFLDKDVTTNGRGDNLPGESRDNDIRRRSKTSSGDNSSLENQHTTQEEVIVQEQTQVTASASTKETKQKELLVDSINIPQTFKEYEWEIIAKSIGLQLKNLDSQQQDFAHKLISDIIFYGKRGKLSESTVILVEPHHPSHLRSEQYFDALRAPNYHNGVVTHQSVYYSPHTPSSSISSPPVAPSQSDYRFLPTTSQRYLHQSGTQSAILPLETTFHHTHAEQGPICVEVRASSGVKHEEIIISDNEDSDDYVFSCS